MNNSQEVMKTIKMIAKEQRKPLGKMLEGGFEHFSARLMRYAERIARILPRVLQA